MTALFNESLNLDAYKSEFSLKRQVRVVDVLDFEFAARTYQALNETVTFDNAMSIDGSNIVVSKEEWEKLSEEKRKNLYFRLMENAAKGKGFSYGRKYVTEGETNSYLSDFFAKLNSAEVLNKISELTGVTGLNYASMQATRYIPGQFLTRHKDVVEAEGRKLAYVFNLSPEWHGDWGGLLQFFNQDGTTTEAWTPTFNTLSLFDVEKIHSVTYVTPFAQKPRYSLTGWFGER